MASESELREQLATCARIFAMQGLLGLHGHVSVYQPEAKRVLITPGAGSDKANLCAQSVRRRHGAGGARRQSARR
jgi:ribulose-5-phosphate 4-epimerase/fuculose-1-phosphate aldolase